MAWNALAYLTTVSLQMKNYSLLLAKVSTWLKAFPKGAPLEQRSLLFIHIFCHITTPYHFETGDGWMTKHFFEGGTMASHDLFVSMRCGCAQKRMRDPSS